MDEAQTRTDRLEQETLHASAVSYLIEGEDYEAAQLLLFCTLESVEVTETDNWNGPTEGLTFALRGPRAACEYIGDFHHPTHTLVTKALNAVLPPEQYVARITVQAMTFVPDADWKRDLLERASGKAVTNQAVGASPRLTWQGFTFRSVTEIRVAEALDRAGVLYFPLPKARMVAGQRHTNIEPDFVVCSDGRWGMLEVDGEPFHPAERSAIEHNRDRLFRNHGVRCVERFDSKRCYQNADAVVREFLVLLAKAHP